MQQAPHADNPQAYLPGDRRRALAEGRTLPDRVGGAALFADISGFTPLTEALADELGPRRGAEELATVLDVVFAALLTELERHGGDVIYFSGDAITAWLDGDDGLTAVACGLAMQRVMQGVGLRTTPTGREFRLGLKVSVAAGSARRFVVGDAGIQLIDVLAGALVDRLAATESGARQGEVAVDAGLAAQLGERVVLAEPREDERPPTVLELASAVRLPNARPPLPDLADDVVRQWLLPRVYERMRAGHGEFLTELRPCVPLFLRFGGIDYDQDPDAISKLDALVTGAQQIVAADGGNVLQLTIGDKGAYLYAVFGAPVAHEDDPARACGSALELLGLAATTAASDLQIGIASGSLRSGTYGHWERRTFACLGDAANLAARLMSAAPAGGILADAEVRRTAGPGFRWGDARELRVGGKSAAVPASPLLARRRSRHDVRASSSALIGRERELAELQQIAETAIGGQGQLALVTGPAGVGKSRLLAELTGWLVDRGAQIGSGAPRSYGARTGYDVWRDICEVAWRIPANADVPAVIAELDAMLRTVDERLLDRLPLLGPLLGVRIPDTALTASFDAKLRKSSLESLMIELVEDSARRRPLAFLIDAAEHLDELSWDLLEALGRAAPRLPLLILIARRASPSDQPTPLARLGHLREVSIGNLDADASGALIRSRLPGHSLTATVIDRVVALAAGNPFHLDEIMNHLAQRGLRDADYAHDADGVDLDLPASLRSLQLARIDDLPESPRDTLKVASVVGVRYAVPAVAGTHPALGGVDAVTEHSLTLAGAALVVHEPGNLVDFAFRNVTTQQVTYETLTFAARSRLHDGALAWLETNAPAGADAILDLLAYHARHGTDLRKRRDYLVRAGIAAQARYANEAAVDYFTAAVPLAEAGEQAPLQRRLGKVLELVGNWALAQQSYEHAATLCAERGDESGLAHARTDLAEVARKQGRFEEAGRLLLSADAAFAAQGDRDGQAAVLHLRGTLAAQQSRYDDARTAYDASLAIRRDLEDKPKIGALLSNLAVVAEQEGDYDNARELNERALAVRMEVGDPWAMSVSQNNLGMIALLQQDYARATAHIEESMRLATEVGDRWIVAVGQHNRGNAQRGLSDYASSGQAFLAALQAYVDYDDHWSLALLIEDVAFLAVDTGQHQAAIELVGAADSLRAELDAPRPPAPAELLEAALGVARAALGPDAEPALAAGQLLPLEEAVELVRATCEMPQT